MTCDGCIHLEIREGNPWCVLSQRPVLVTTSCEGGDRIPVGDGLRTLLNAYLVLNHAKTLD